MRATPVRFTQEHDDILRALYATEIPMPELAAMVNHGIESTYRRAIQIGLSRPRVASRVRGMTDAILHAAARPNGVMRRELPYSTKTLQSRLRKMVDASKLYPARFGSRDLHYFTTEAARDAALEARPKPKPKAQPTLIIRARQGWGKNDPAHLPLDDAGRPLWKLTIAPPPVPALRTNTYAVW